MKRASGCSLFSNVFSFFSFPNLLPVFLLALVYYAAGRVGQMIALPPGYVSAFWPPSGIALGAVLIYGYRLLPGVFLGSFFNNILLFPPTPETIVEAILSCTGIGLGAALQAYVGAYCVHRFTGSQPFETVGNAFKFIGISLLSCLINSNVGLFSLSFFHSVNWLETWWTWWIGDATGVLIFTPLLLGWLPFRFQKISFWKLLEALSIFICILLVFEILFHTPFFMTYFLIPIVVWICFRFQLQGVSLAIVFISFLAIQETMNGKGPFYYEGSLNTSWVMLEIFYGTLTSLALLLVGALAERRRSTQLLKSYSADLEKKVKERTVELQAQLDKIRKMQQHIIKREKLASLGILTAGVAHEIKNPIGFIFNFSELSLELMEEIIRLLNGQKGKIGEPYSIIVNKLELAQTNLSRIKEHALKANQTIQDMLTEVRDHSRGFRVTDLNQLIQEYIKLSFQSRQEKNPFLEVHIKTELDPSLRPFSFHRQDIGRVILNLLDNALDSVEEKEEGTISAYQPQVLIQTKDLGKDVELVIIDNGLGISDEIKSKIFEPFFSKKSVREGVGLGLSISHDIVVKEHGGFIGVESEEGVYASFTIILPKENPAQK